MSTKRKKKSTTNKKYPKHMKDKLPKNKILRIAIGIILILMGMLGFLPILGFWMIPLGIIILSIDIPAVRRWKRKIITKFGAGIKKKFPILWKYIGENKTQ